MKKLQWAAGSIAALMLLAAGAQAQAAGKAPDYKIVGYYIGMESGKRKYTPLDIDGRLITHLNYAFADIKNGEIALMNPHEEVEVQDNFGKLRQLKKAHPHLKTLISVGGWTGSKEFSNVALTPEARAKFAASSVDFIRKYGFDGVDIDWEFPVSGGDAGNVTRPEDKQNFTLFLQALRTALDAASKKDRKKYLLTAALGNNKTFIKNTEMDKVAKILDWSNIMTYDFNGPWSPYAGHNTPLYADPATARPGVEYLNIADIVDAMVGAGVPAKNLVLGMAFYGYSWKQCGAQNNGQHQDCKGKGPGTWEEGALVFDDINANYVNKKGYVRYWNDAAKVPYLYNSATGEFVTYDDVESLDHKLKFLKAKGLGGAMFWEITGDRNFVLENKLVQELKPKTKAK